MADRRAREWSRQEEVLQGALDLPEEEREAFLRRACVGDADLRREVETLLALEDKARDFVEAPLFPRPSKGEEVGLSKGARIGDFRLEERIAQGGMGTVWRGVRAGQDFRQQVAIKVLRSDLETREIVARFRYERQILAGLNHPNIATFQEGGTTPDGRPFFVMEFVEGEPLDVFLAQRDLPLPRRLEVFQVICSAVDYAHRKLVVHRDLKPENILVTEDEMPVLLDFGIAKILSPEVVPLTGQFPTTRRFGSPYYASPEQLDGSPISVATDVFSLGVLLYFIATGRRPPTSFYDSHQLGPSLSPWGHRKGPEDGEGRGGPGPGEPSGPLSEDLESIVRKAMLRDPEERYSNVRELSNDIRRLRAGKPVLAREGSIWYRGKKFARRNVWKLIAASCLALTGSLMAFQDFQRRQQRADERALADLTDAVIDLVEEVQSDPPGATELATEAAGSAWVQALDAAWRELRRAGTLKPDERARRLQDLGRLYHSSGAPRKAAEALEESLSIRRSILEPNDPDLALSLELLAEARRHLGRPDEGIEHAKAALEIRRQIGDPWQLTNSTNHLALLKRSQGNFGEAIALYREALQVARFHAEGEDDGLLSTILANLGASLQETGRLAAAESHLREAVAMRQRLRGPQHGSLASPLRNLGHVLLQKGEIEEAGRHFQRSLEIRIAAHKDPEDHPAVAKGMRSLAIYYQARGELEEAERLLAEALAVFRRRYGAAHPQTARTLRAQAALRLEQGRPAEAQRLAREGLRLLEASLPEAHWQIADLRCLLAAAWIETGALEPARRLLGPARRRLLASKGASSPEAIYAQELQARVGAVAD